MPFSLSSKQDFPHQNIRSCVYSHVITSSRKSYVIVNIVNILPYLEKGSLKNLILQYLRKNKGFHSLVKIMSSLAWSIG